MELIWLGNLSTAPSSPALNNAYYNVIDKKSYIWDGDSWEQMTEDGWDGAFKSTIYKSSVARPANPQQDGSYDGDSEVPPTGWSTTPVATTGSALVWISISRYFWNGTIWTNTIWSEPLLLSGRDGSTPVKDVDYYDGESGAYVSSIYHNSAVAPTTPVGGTFDGNPSTETMPAGDWTDGPNTPITNELTWVSVRRYYQVGSIWVGGDWTTPARNSGLVGPAPVKGIDYTDADGTYTSYVFRIEPEGTVPVAPTNGSYDGTEVVPTLPVPWNDDPTSPLVGEVSWVTKAVYRQTNGVWNSPVWSVPAKFSGADGYTPEVGVDYADGKDGSFTSYIFRNGLTAPAQASGGSYDGSNEVYPTNWTDNPIAAPPGEAVYMARCKYINTGTTLVPTWEREEILGTLDNWSRPVQFSGGGGTPGARGTKRYYTTTTGVVWVDSIADAAITAAGDVKIEWDIVTMSNVVGGYTETRYWDGANWIVIDEVIDGSLLVDGTVIGAAFNSTTTITAGAGANSAGMNGSTVTGYNGWRFWSGASLPGTANYRVNSAGKMWATDAVIEGEITLGVGGTALTDTNTLNENTTKDNVGLNLVPNYSAATMREVAAATSGTVAGWRINSVAIYSGVYQASNAYTTSGITLHKDGAIRAKNFRIDTTGDAYFKGNITGGTITIGTSFSVTSTGAMTASSARLNYMSSSGGASNSAAAFDNASSFRPAIDVKNTLNSGSAVGVYGQALQGLGIHGNGYNGIKGSGDTITGRGVHGHGSRGVFGEGTVYDFYAAGSGTNYGPFTGGHDGLLPIGSPEFEVGDIVCDVKVVNSSNVSNAICEMVQSSKPNQKGVSGVLVSRRDMDPLDLPAALDYHVEAHVLLTDIYDIISFNAVGEGLMNVCGEGGDLEIGDLIVSSSIPGKGMKQSDDLMRSTTVARVRENITFSSPMEVKQIAVIYHCG